MKNIRKTLLPVPEHLLSNADLPGMEYGWGVGMYVSAP